MSYDYRRARDWVFGMIREEDRVVAYKPGPASIQERALLLALVEFAPNIEPSTTAVATMLGTNERQVRRLLRSSEQKGLIRVVHRNGMRSRYLLTVMDPGLSVPPDESSPRAISPPTPDGQSSPPRTHRPPKQTSKADKKADRRERGSRRSPALHQAPADFVFNDADREAEETAKKRGVDVEEARRVWLAFTYEKPKKDLHQAWRNWLAKERSRGVAWRRSPAPQETPEGSTFDDEAERRAEEVIGKGNATAKVLPFSAAGGAT